MSPQPPSILRHSPMVSAYPSFKDKPAHDLPVQTGSSQAHFQLFARQLYILINRLQTYFPPVHRGLSLSSSVVPAG